MRPAHTLGELSYLNGRLLEAGNACISLNDRAFLFGDGVYEVVRSYGGRLFSLAEHMQRLKGCLAAVDLAFPDPTDELAGLITDLYRRSAMPDALIYVQITRGSEPRNHLFSLDLTPNVYINVRAVPPGSDTYTATAVTMPDERWHMCHVKSTSLIANILAKHRARLAGADDPVFVRGDTVTEAASSNVFLVEGGVLFTHPADNHVLAGVTRRHVLDLAAARGIPVREEKCHRDRLAGAGEIFLSDSLHDVSPVLQLDGQPVGDGRPGRVTTLLKAAFRELSR